MSETPLCRHCQVAIVWINYAGGAHWMHTRGFDLYWHCKTTVAGTVAGPEVVTEVLTGQVPAPDVRQESP